jgi:hypothetical protein
MSGLEPEDRRCKSCRADQFQTVLMLSWPNISGIRLLSGTMQVGILPAAPRVHSIARWCQSSPDSESGLNRLSWCDSKSGSHFRSAIWDMRLTRFHGAVAVFPGFTNSKSNPGNP